MENLIFRLFLIYIFFFSLFNFVGNSACSFTFINRYLNKFSDHTFYMAEDLGLCTFQKHHKLKILLFLFYVIFALPYIYLFSIWGGINPPLTAAENPNAITKISRISKN